MAVKTTEVESEHQVFKCPDCEGFVIILEERAYDGDRLLSKETWVEHHIKLPDWASKETIREMGVVGIGK